MTYDCHESTAEPNQTIPGLVVGCVPVDSLLQSSLECFYNISCIEMIIQWRSFGYVNLTVDPRVLSVTPLNPVIDSQFFPHTKLEDIISQALS
jgi:hypothetical protein